MRDRGSSNAEEDMGGRSIARETTHVLLPWLLRGEGSRSRRHLLALGRSLASCLALSAGHGAARRSTSPVSSLVRPTSPRISQWPVMISRGVMPHTTRRHSRISSSLSRPPRIYAPLCTTQSAGVCKW